MIRKIFLSFLLVLVFLYCFLGLFLYLFQNSFFYPADKTDFLSCPEFKDSKKITGDFKGYFTERSTEKVIVYYHGNGGRACDRFFMDTLFKETGYSTLFVEYPGYAENTTTTMEDILQEVTSIDKFIRNKNFKEIVVIGESVGSGPASYQTTLSNKISKVILITPYDNMVNVAFYHFPFYPMNLLVKNNFTPDEWLKVTLIPITLILAGNDEIVSFDQGKKLYDSIQAPNKSKFTIENVGHNSIYENEQFYSILKEELETR